MAQCFSMFYHISISILLPIIIAQDTFLTDEYGNQNGNYYSTLDQGRISQINNWGVDFTGIHIRDWRSDEQTEYSETYGYGWYHQSCPSLNISQNDYIIGYKIYIDTTTYYVDDEDEEITVSMDIIRGLVFYTLKGDSYSCIEDASVDSYTQIYTNYYLSGWNIYSQKVLNSIQFQFTQINASGLSIANIASSDDIDPNPDTESTSSSTNNDDINAPSPSSTQNLELNDSMEVNDDFDFFSSTVNSQSESAENPTETKYPQSEDSKDSPSSTLSSSQSADDDDDSHNIENTSESNSESGEENDDDTSSEDNSNIKSEIEQTQTILIDGQSIDDTTSTTKVIHAVEQDNDDRELGKKGISQYFQGTEGKVVVVSTMLILAFTLILCCVLTICVINIKRKKRRHEANQSVIDGDLNLHEPSPDNDDNEIKLTIPTRRVGEKGTGQSSTNLSICSHDIQVSIDGIDGMDGNDTMLHERPNNVDINIANLLSPRYGRRGTNESNGEWPINPVPIKNNKRKKRRPPVPLDHPYSIDWNEPQMQKLTDKMANLFNEEDNRNGSFISTVNTRNNKSRQFSQMTGISAMTGSGSGHGHGSETDDAETDNDTDLMYNHMGPLNERKVTPETKGGDDESDDQQEQEEEEEHEEEEEEQAECLNVNKDGASPFNYVPRRNALKLLNVRSNTFGH